MISEETIRRVKEAADVVEVISEYVELKKKGANYQACCPFHEEKSPSFAVTPAKNRYKCFGCGKGGDSTSFLMEKGMTYPDAITHLAKKYNIEIEQTESTYSKEERKVQDDYATVTRGALGHYTRSLHERPEMLGILARERFISIETIIDFQLGYAPDDWKFLTLKVIPKGYFRAAEKLGLIKFRKAAIPQNTDGIDDLFVDAARVLVQNNTASTSLIQRRLKLGYNRAGRIMDQLAKEGIIEMAAGPKQWELKIKTESELDALLLSKNLSLPEPDADSVYDFFRHRLMVPIINTRSTVIGFGGRKFEDDNKENPKWMNSPECEGFFEKKNNLYGLNLAAEAIRKQGCAYLVEGYFDVISFFQSGVENTVATMGTAFTDEQARLLKRYTNNVIIARDADNAGNKSALDAVDTCLEFGLTPYFLRFPDGEDPDSFARKMRDFKRPLSGIGDGYSFATLQASFGMTLSEYIGSNTFDAVLWKIEEIMRDIEGPVKRGKAAELLADMLALVGSEHTRNDYIAHVKKEYKLDIAKQVKAIIKDVEDSKAIHDSTQEGKLPPWAQAKLTELQYNGFIAREDVPDETGFWIEKGKNYMEKISNFTFKYIMHIRDDDDDKRILEVFNGYQRQYVDMPSKSMVSLDQFITAMYQLEGNMLFEGDRKQLYKLLAVLGKQCQIAHEIKTLGWQPEGFFAFSNGIVDESGKFVEMNQYGLVKFGERNYYSPSSSQIYKNRRDDNDPYENDRYLIYRPSDISFATWAKQFCLVYPENNAGYLGVAYLIATLFRDVCFKMDQNFPHFSAYGESGSGKSKFAESLSNVFFNQMRPLNVFHSTDFAFANRFTRYSNCLGWADEVNDLTMKEERFENLKAAYEGILRERGKGGSKSKTEILKCKSGIIMTGQYLSTKDDMAMINRCNIKEFEKRTGERARTQEEIQAYDLLKGWEKTGLSNIIVELLGHRKVFKDEYAESFAERFRQLREAVTKENSEYNERVLRNYNVLLTAWHFFSTRYDMPIPYVDFFNLMVQDVIKLSLKINTSNALADFWNTIVYLMETGEIYDGFYFKVEEHTSVSISQGEESGKRQTSTKSFGTARKLLFIRLTTVHKMYSEAYRRQNGKNGLTMATLDLYLNREKGFIGKSPSGWFHDKDGRKTNTSSYVFDYDLLGVQLEQQKVSDEEKVMTTITGKVQNLRQEDIMGKPMLTVQHMEESSYMLVGHPTIKTVWTKLYDADLSRRDIYESGQQLSITGVLKVVNTKDKPFRSMQVEKVAAVNIQTQITPSTEKAVDADDLPF